MMLDSIDAYDDYQPLNATYELIQFMNDWCEISARRDVAALDAMLADDLVCTTSDGRVLTKSEYLAVIGSLPADFRITAFDQTAQILADTGIVRAIYRVQYADHEAIHVRTTATFIKRAGKWTVVAVHSNVIETADAKKSPPRTKHAGEL